MGAAISRLTGTVVYYAGTPRVFVGEESFSRAFLDLLDDQTTLVLVGCHTVEPDVSPGLLKRKAREITLVGLLKAPRSLVPLLQVLPVERQGAILALEDEGPRDSERG